MPADDTPPDVPGFTTIHLFDDPTPNSIIQHRIVRRLLEAAKYSDLDTKEAGDFVDLVILIGRKMCSVWKHLDAYHAEEGRLVAKFSDPTIKHVEYSQTLYEEFDVFTVQIKSTLDHLVKVMRPILGKSWTMYTFSDKGDGVLKALRNNAGKKYEGRVRSMEHLLFSDLHKVWLERIIDSRDRMNHGVAGGLKIETFAVLRRPSGQVEVPMWSDEQKLGHASEKVWANFFSFVEDFLMLALHFRIPEDKYSVFKRPEPITSATSPWIVMSASLARGIVSRPGWRPV